MKRTVLVLIAGWALCGPVAAQEIAADESEPQPPSESVWTPGLVFATDSILLDLFPFNGGIGMTLRSEDTAIRGSLGVFGSNNRSTTTLAAGVWYVNYLWTERVSPYWTAFARTDILSQTEKTDDDNWTRDFSLSLGAGVSLGVEFFLLDFLALFAEYSLSAGATGQRDVVGVDGEVTKGEFEWRYTAGTNLAHGGAIGVIVYFRPQVTLGKE